MLPLFGRLSFGKQDIIRLAGFALGYVPSALIPARFDPWIIGHLTALALRLGPGKAERMASRMSEALGPRAEGRDLTPEAVTQYQAVLENGWARIRSVHKRGWKPSTSVEGLERIKEARAAGSGTILWRMSFGSTLNVKIALWRIGIPIVHLSHETHGSWSDVRIASRALRFLYRRTENWYLEERVIIPRTGGRGKVMKTLLGRLMQDNAVVSILGDITGSQNVTTPFFDGKAQFATGSPSLAWKAKSALLPVYAVRQGIGDYRIVIEEPIAVDRTLDRKEFVRQAVVEFSERMQDAIARHPGSWSNWGRFLGSGSRALEVSPGGPQPTVG